MPGDGALHRRKTTLFVRLGEVLLETSKPWTALEEQQGGVLDILCRPFYVCMPRSFCLYVDLFRLFSA